MLPMIERIDKILAEKGIKQSELERLAGLAENRISRWKAGQGEPTARQAVRIARLLDVPLDWLTDDRPAVESPPSPGMPARDERQVLDLLRQSGISFNEALLRLATPRTTAAPREARAAEAQVEVWNVKADDNPPVSPTPSRTRRLPKKRGSA